MTPETVRRALTPSTRAVVAVDLFGCPAPVAELRELGLPVLEDAAQALGASLGRPAGRRARRRGHDLLLSLEEPGRLRRRGRHRHRRRRGGRAGAGAALPRIDGTSATSSTSATTRGWTSSRRRSCASCFPISTSWVGGPPGRRGGLSARPGWPSTWSCPAVPAGAEPAWHLYVVTTAARRSRYPDALAGHGIQARGYYRTPLHRQPAMSRWGAGAELPVTEELARTNLALPMSPILGPEAARRGGGGAGRGGPDGGIRLHERNLTDLVVLGSAMIFSAQLKHVRRLIALVGTGVARSRPSPRPRPASRPPIRTRPTRTRGPGRSPRSPNLHPPKLHTDAAHADQEARLRLLLPRELQEPDP